jgi:type IV pilus assembly protein PilA
MSTLRKGFTLIELLLVIGIIAILASIVIVAINPTRQLGNSRDAQRRADVLTILNAVYQYAIDSNGTIPTGITTTTKYVCSGLSACGGNGADLSVLTLSGKYIVSIPRDPQSATLATCPGSGSVGSGACYQIVKDANNRVTVTAPFKEIATSISVTR